MRGFAKLAKPVKKGEEDIDAVVDFIGLGNTKPGKEQKHREDWFEHLFNDRKDVRNYLVTTRSIKGRFSTPYEASKHIAKVMSTYPGTSYLLYANACIGAGLIGISHVFDKITGCEIDRNASEALKHNIGKAGLSEKFDMVKVNFFKILIIFY